ncbi:transporter substrate-binding domain-containing protein [Bordetella genomosp. 4]|uniref:ABC transporter substrate-binding protein n=1 Tax=Bordetella genomosp. 4 TaxID=463044 RepID=A0A261TTY0_9BORD|nr:transporter substrate-binding domain-containing protein [Bordetella genomosp. 4]OZI45221.1 ABC transporter substrate-binding protein [Bordetella genomosp. 4]OZI53116.1 ABC transporter substrate-binding protein [Bordetella genomosp. 4]
MKRRELLSHSALIGAAAIASVGVPARASAQAAPGNESTLDRVRKTGILRMGVIVGQAPYFTKNLADGTWSGACLSMANDIAKKLNAKVETVETTWGNQILDLQSNKIDLAFAVNPTPERALMVDFATPILVHSFTAVTRKGFAKPETWNDLNKPEVRISVDMGSAHELIARRYAPNATILSFKTRDEAVLAVATGRADCNVVLAILALPMLKKNPALAEIAIPRPVLTLPTNIAVRLDNDKRWRDFLSVWADYNRSMAQTREWFLQGLAELDVKESDIPPEVQF